MPFIVFSIWQFAGIALGVAGLAYLILAVRAVSRFRERAVFGAEPRPGVSVLKPVYGTNAQLYESLRSFCLQDYPKYEVIFGAHTADDPAIAVVNRLIAENPGLDLRLVVDETLAGANRKAANLANIARTAKYDLFVLADSDVRVDPDCVASMAAIKAFGTVPRPRRRNRKAAKPSRSSIDAAWFMRGPWSVGHGSHAR